MRAAAGLAVAADPAMAARTRIVGLRSDPPVTLRPTAPIGAAPFPRWHLRDPRHAWVSIAAAAAGPIGGDHISVDVDVGDGATLVARSVAATLVLPGPHGDRSRAEVTVTVGAGATLVWSTGPVIAARGCDHHATTRIALAPGARLLVLDELVLGRHAEPCGTIRQRLRVCIDDRPVHDQEVHLGPFAAGSEGPAVTGRQRALGSVLIVDPGAAGSPAFREPRVWAELTTARFPLAGPASLVTALAPDLPALRHRMATALAELEAALDDPSPTDATTPGAATAAEPGGRRGDPESRD